MPWKCPACGTNVKSDADGDKPRVGVVYRCHVCRLELTVDVKNGVLVLVPLDRTPPPKR